MFLIVERKSYKIVKCLLVNLSPQPHFAADHIPVLSVKVGAILPMNGKNYRENWDYYESVCEASSSLTYPVNAINSVDNDMPFKFVKYLRQSALVDVEDIFGIAWQGVHAGCMAGAWYAMLRGVFGVRVLDNAIHIAVSYTHLVRLPFTTAKKSAWSANSIIRFSMR